MNGLIERSVSASSTQEVARAGGMDVKGIEQVIDRFSQSWNQHDAVSFSALFDEDGDFVNVAGHHASGRSGIESEFLALHSDPVRISVLTNPKIAVRMVAPDVAVAVTRWRRGSWAASEVRQGSGFYILVKRGQQWRIRNARLAGIAASFEPAHNYVAQHC